jgi:hypothetical protein
MRKNGTGAKVIDMLLGLAEGESMLVGSVEWTALGGWFEKAEDYGEGDSYVVHADGLDDDLDVEAQYEVLR